MPHGPQGSEVDQECRFFCTFNTYQATFLSEPCDTTLAEYRASFPTQGGNDGWTDRHGG